MKNTHRVVHRCGLFEHSSYLDQTTGVFYNEFNCCSQNSFAVNSCHLLLLLLFSHELIATMQPVVTGQTGSNSSSFVTTELVSLLE